MSTLVKKSNGTVARVKTEANMPVKTNFKFKTDI